jgi:NCS1 family nucleobase:cation symporter-1
MALVVGVAPNVPGFLAQAFPGGFAGVTGFWKGLYSYAWFVGFALAGGVYLVLMRGRDGASPGAARSRPAGRLT